MRSTEQPTSPTEQAAVPEDNFQKKLIGATRDFIRAWVPQPEFYGTLTYRKEVKEDQAKKIFREFRRDVAKLYGTHLRVAWGEEYQGRNVFHHHFLVAGIPAETTTALPRVTAADLCALWKHGVSKIEQYDPERSDPYHGAALYLAKHENWDVDVACPRLRACKRKDGCKVARSIW